jgi:hypothetical protein
MATGSSTSHNRIVRLRPRSRAPAASLGEGDCYAHSYGEHVSDHVDVVPLESAGTSLEVSDLAPGLHVSTDRIKRQFEERLAARARRR